MDALLQTGGKLEPGDRIPYRLAFAIQSPELLAMVTLILSMPPNWDIRPEFFSRLWGWGRDKRRKIFKEAVTMGYLTLEKPGGANVGTYYRKTDLLATQMVYTEEEYAERLKSFRNMLDAKAAGEAYRRENLPPENPTVGKSTPLNNKLNTKQHKNNNTQPTTSVETLHGNTHIGGSSDVDYSKVNLSFLEKEDMYAYRNSITTALRKHHSANHPVNVWNDVIGDSMGLDDDVASEIYKEHGFIRFTAAAVIAKLKGKVDSARFKFMLKVLDAWPADEPVVARNSQNKPITIPAYAKIVNGHVGESGMRWLVDNTNYTKESFEIVHEDADRGNNVYRLKDNATEQKHSAKLDTAPSRGITGGEEVLHAHTAALANRYGQANDQGVRTGIRAHQESS